ncbi:N2227-domain-containing protein [Pseudovirgaria hyperparasitica]|uniref:carnosine N-methyltransferase n=1 Tax=Pseudovirgaria hyperparasitica TaxID=470096 RepID=A0A6A6W334_9PEZI|nr:N2227-domain-containing protein [Pseudovirgaria hyperparasitica]KAF2757013.1 N2227-domain-containing protein [Pseudovirgaria hyperparasitica]
MDLQMADSEPSSNGNDPMQDPEEQKVLKAALDSYESYRKRSHHQVTHVRRQSFYALPSAHSTILSAPPFSVLGSLSAIDDAIDANANIADAIVQAAKSTFLPPTFPTPWTGYASASDHSKARSTIRQFYRDWSAEGATERAACYDPVLSALCNEFANTPDESKSALNVLVPGAGLGRLLLEIVLLGFSAEGNEISYHQLLASSWVLNHTKPDAPFTLYPWALAFSNHVTRADQLANVSVPDVHPGLALGQAIADGKSGKMGFSTGDFCVEYGSEDTKNTYDAVASVFFLDTAPNPIRYVEAVRNCLKSGGIWINLGPLLWHFENNPPGAFYKSDDDESGSGKFKSGFEGDRGIGEAGSVELTNEEVLSLVGQSGFTIEKHEFGALTSGYIQDPKSMLQNIYKPSFWIARKQ